jgi:RimJ/RimL family protein N-acetyltransferase
VTEALKKFLNYLFEFKRQNITTIMFSIHPDNHASLKIASKIGAAFKSEAKNYAETQPRLLYSLDINKIPYCEF